MLKGAENQSLYVEHYDYVLAPETRQAYLYLIGWASTLKEYECYPSFHGVIKDFRFMRGEDWDFAFIPNQQWLLFYFRKPCLRLPKYSRDEILSRFPDASENPSGEFTTKVTSLPLAVRISEYIGR